ncbi:hypothetical protein [Sphingobium sp. Z007]|uniref:hypothetical protein n=1 Tax=Sphingobium sp. Z007 TaxID=627495 RepID=UPI000B49C1A7|nr:hypothetical protein [Sphingobium sp. Z007]
MILTDTERAAATAIIANIADLEAARQFLTDKMDKWLLKEMLGVLESKARTFDWYHAIKEDNEDTYFIMPRDWAASGPRRDKCEEDAWFYLGWHNGEGDSEWESWVACAVGKAVSGSWLEFGFGRSVVTKTLWRKILTEYPVIVEQLRGLGFAIEPRDGLIDYPVTLDPDALARAFEANDFSEASAPLERAIDMAAKAKPLLDPLVAAIRARI